MKKFILSAVLLMVAAAVNASELPKLTPRIMQGPLIGVTMVTRDDLGQYHAQLFNGAGYEIGISFVDAETFSWFAIGLPQVMSADSATDSFRYSLGLSMKLMGNFGVGASRRQGRSRSHGTSTPSTSSITKQRVSGTPLS